MSSNPNRVYDWSRLASPAPSSASGSTSSASSSFQYPNTPHLRPVALPVTEGPNPSLGYSYGFAESRARSASNPQAYGTALGMSGMYSPPETPERVARPSYAPSVHPTLRAAAPLLLYDVQRPPRSSSLHTADGARISSAVLSNPATHPPTSSLCVAVTLHPRGPDGPARRYLWPITLAPNRRASAPPTATTPLTVGDALASLHLSLLVPVVEAECAQFSSREIQSARAMCAARRASAPNSPPGLVRADFLHGCTAFAGFVRNADNSFSVRLAPPM